MISFSSKSAGGGISSFSYNSQLLILKKFFIVLTRTDELLEFADSCRVSFEPHVCSQNPLQFGLFGS